MSDTNFDSLKTIPLKDIILRAAKSYTYGLGGDTAAQDAQAIAQIRALSPESQRVVWLVWLLSGWGPNPKEGLHTFFYLSGGNYAPEVQRALVEAGLSRLADVFGRAIAVFGAPYPTERRVREKHFAWSQSAPLNAFDHQIIALGKEFGDRDSLAEGVVSYVRRTPVMARWVDGWRTGLSEYERLRFLTGRLYTPSDKAALAEWPRPYRLLYLLDLFNLEMLNGGVHQYFANSSGDVAREVAEALREAGLPEHARAVEKGMAMFGESYPTDRAKREPFLFRGGESTDFDDKLEALIGEVDDGAIERAMLKLAKEADVLPR